MISRSIHKYFVGVQITKIPSKCKENIHWAMQQKQQSAGKTMGFRRSQQPNKSYNNSQHTTILEKTR